MRAWVGAGVNLNMKLMNEYEYEISNFSKKSILAQSSAKFKF